jgi:hypothetical protein
VGTQNGLQKPNESEYNHNCRHSLGPYQCLRKICRTTYTRTSSCQSTREIASSSIYEDWYRLGNTCYFRIRLIWGLLGVASWVLRWRVLVQYVVKSQRFDVTDVTTSFVKTMLSSVPHVGQLHVSVTSIGLLSVLSVRKICLSVLNVFSMVRLYGT